MSSLVPPGRAVARARLGGVSLSAFLIFEAMAAQAAPEELPAVIVTAQYGLTVRVVPGALLRV